MPVGLVIITNNTKPTRRCSMNVYPITFYNNKGKSAKLEKPVLAFFSEGLSIKKAYHSLFVIGHLAQNGSFGAISLMVKKAMKALADRSTVFEPEDIDQIVTGLCGFTPTKFTTADGKKFAYPGTIAVLCSYIEFCKKMIDKKHGIYLWEYDGMNIYSDFQRIPHVFHEYFAGSFPDFYKFDVVGKTILDVGGFIGDSALYFLQNGAKKVLVYDPIKENLLCAKHNLKKYAGEYELHQYFVCNKNGTFEINSLEPPSSIGFGACTPGRYFHKAKCISIENVLRKSKNVDIAKFDCEGCEYDLLGAPNHLIKKIPYWSVEFHEVLKNRKKMNAVINKFSKCGFHMARTYWQSPDLAICDFAIIPRDKKSIT